MLLLCCLRAPVLRAALQSHAGLIMSSGKRNVFTKCAGFAKLAPDHVYKTHRCSCAQPLAAAGGALAAGEPRSRATPSRGGHTPLPALALGVRRHRQDLPFAPFSGTTGRCVCGWVGGQAVSSRSIIRSSL